MNSFTIDFPLRIVTLCSGYDSQCLAMERLKQNYPGFDYDLTGWSEIDKYAIKAHNTLFPQWSDRNLGDMTKIDWDKVDDFDFLFYSTPLSKHFTGRITARVFRGKWDTVVYYLGCTQSSGKEKT